MTSKKEAILQAALILFTERGYDGTTVPMIADQANVGAGTIYRYFENKEYLVNELFTIHIRELSAALQVNFPHDETNFREKFRYLFFSITNFAKQNLHVLLFIDSTCSALYLTDENQELFENFMQFIHNQLVHGQENQEIRQVHPDALISIVYGAIIQLYKLIRFGAISEENGLLETVEDCCWNAIKF